MRSKSIPAAIGTTVTQAFAAAACGGAGSLAVLALRHTASTPVLAAGAVTAAFAASAAAAGKALSGTIGAVSGLLTALIRARADARATIIHARVRAELARAGLDPGRTPQAAEMQRILSVNPDLPRDRRPADETLIKLCGSARARSSSGEPGTSPDTSGGNPGNPKGTAGKVVPIRSDT